MNLSNKTVDELWQIYEDVEKELKERGLLRSKNIKGERGEEVALNYYNNTPNLPKLQRTPQGTAHVDAISRDGERYAIKTISKGNSTTGTFQADDFTKQRFEYLIVVVLDGYRPYEILETPWEAVSRYKKYHKTMKAYNISLTKALRKECKIIFDSHSTF